MKKTSIIVLILLALTALSAQTAAAQRKYKTYSNARFGYSVSYPSDLLTPQGEAENGDGQIFTGSGAEMRVYGSNLLLNETLRREYNALLKEKGGSVTYKTITANFFVVSGRADGKIFYRKTMKNADGAFLTFMIEYDETERATYDAVVTRIVKSFK